MRADELVLVEWIDSHSGKDWQPLDEIAKAARPVRCRSVGWLVSQENQTTVLVAHLAGEGDGDLRTYGCGDMAIPTGAIVRMVHLRVGRRPSTSEKTRSPAGSMAPANGCRLPRGA
jgi:hypothetical protein